MANEKAVWDYLRRAGMTESGAAGVMGNMQAESGIISNRVEILCLKRLRENGKVYDDASYTAAVDSGKISKAEFLNPLPGKQYGYGYCQWTSPGRKSGLYDLCKQKGVSIGDMYTQLDFLISELKTSYKQVWNVCTSSGSVQECVDTFLVKFEIPANAESHKPTRRKYAWDFYYKFYGTALTTPPPETKPVEKQEEKPVEKPIDKAVETGGGVMISNCSGDEKNGYIGGKAGDQTGGEWRIRTWYNRPWKCVLRHPDEKVRATIADLATKAANNDHIGYDQGERTTFWTQLQKVGYQPEKITVNCEADCSSGVAAIVRATGIILNITALKNVDYNLSTHYMRNAFKNAGFTVLTDSKYLTSDAYLVPGDLLLNDSHHVCTCISKGSKATSSSTPAATAPTTPHLSNKLYHVQAATYDYSRTDLADACIKKLKDTGVCKDAYKKTVASNGKKYWVVQAGAFSVKENAERRLQELSNIGIEGMIW